jgi:hypothetical protein
MLLQKLPLELQDGLSVVTASGVEIIINQVMRLDEEFLVLRGRLSGSVDNGRVYFVPYDQMNCLIYNRAVKGNEIHRWFNEEPEQIGSSMTSINTDPDAMLQDPVTEEGAGALPGFAAAGLTSGGAGPDEMSPAKAAMLERLRARAVSKSVQGTARKPGLSVSSQGTAARPGLSVQGVTPKPTGQSIQGTNRPGQSIQGNTQRPGGSPPNSSPPPAEPKK